MTRRKQRWSLWTVLILFMFLIGLALFFGIRYQKEANRRSAKAITTTINDLDGPAYLSTLPEQTRELVIIQPVSATNDFVIRLNLGLEDEKLASCKSIQAFDIKGGLRQQIPVGDMRAMEDNQVWAMLDPGTDELRIQATLELEDGSGSPVLISKEWTFEREDKMLIPVAQQVLSDPIPLGTTHSNSPEWVTYRQR